MSHFCVLVIGSEPEEQLAKYDYDLDVEMRCVLTKEQIIHMQRERRENYRKNYYEVYLSNPVEYEKNCSHNPNHIKYLTEEFPKRLKWTDEQLYDEYISDYRDYVKDGADWCEVHEDGSLWKTTNDGYSKWNWYQIGGRYRGRLKLKTPDPEAPLYSGWQYGDKDEDYERLKAEGYCDQALAKDVSNLHEITTFAVVKDGEWYERGEMGLWGCVSNEKEADDWDAEVKALLIDLPGDTLLTVVDCHI